MKTFLSASATLLLAGVALARTSFQGPPAFPPVDPELALPGERLDPSAFGPAWIETMDEVLERERVNGAEPTNQKWRGDAAGIWEVPSIRWTRPAHSGRHYVAAKWGDTRMGIGFGQVVDLDGVWVAGHMDPTMWTSALRAVGYRAGEQVATTPWFADIGELPAWFAIGLEDIDRVVFEAVPIHGGAGFYGLDDLTFTTANGTVVIDFEDAGYRQKLTGTNHAGLTWETGAGDFTQEGLNVVHPPQVPPGYVEPVGADDDGADPGEGTDAGTLPPLVRKFLGPNQNSPGAGGIPPDTHGAIGTTQFVSVVNQNISIYNKASGNQTSSTSLASFFSNFGGNGDPRVLFDHIDQRWIVIASNFSNRVRFAYSLGDNANGAWFKTSIDVSQGSNANDWPDYPTVGFDANGIYISAFMVGSVGMSIFAIDKAPLLQATPSMGTVTAWRQLTYEGAVQPCVTYGSPPGEYLVSRASFNLLRLRRINPPLASPTLSELGFVSTINGNPPPSAPALGSNTNLDTLDGRLMNAVYRNGSVWTTNGVSKGGRAAINWYEVDPLTTTVVQQGSVRDGVNHYFMPSIGVNANNDVALGFSASNPNMFVGAWYTGRAAGDPPGDTADEVEYKGGNSAYNQTSSGVNRWGDYSMTSVDPVDDTTFYTIQEFAKQGGEWGTNIAELGFPPTCGVVVSYCTPGTSASGCTATMSSAGVPSATAASGFTVSVSGVEGLKDGLIFFGENGRQANPWGSSSSRQCVVTPVKRTGLQSGVGTAGLCDGSFDLDLNAYWTANPQKNPGSGTQVNTQCWYRDPFNTSNQTTSLSDALEFTTCP